MAEKYHELLQKAADKGLNQGRGSFVSSEDSIAFPRCYCAIGAIASVQIKSSDFTKVNDHAPLVEAAMTKVGDKFLIRKKTRGEKKVLSGNLTRQMIYWNDSKGYTFAQIAKMLKRLGI